MTFWERVAEQLAELRTAASADDVVRALAHERNPYGGVAGAGSGDAFFAGSGGDDTVMEALLTAGWSVEWAKAPYHYAMVAPDGASGVEYVEGDIYRHRRGGE